MQNEIVSGVAAVAKFVLIQVLWVIILFNLGRGTFLLLTLGRYPRGRWLEEHATRIAFAGLATLLLVWTSIVVYNRTIGA